MEDVIQLGSRRWISVGYACEMASCRPDDLAEICFVYAVPHRVVGRNAVYVDELAFLAAFAQIEMTEPQIRAPHFNERNRAPEKEVYLPAPPVPRGAESVLAHLALPLAAIALVVAGSFVGLQLYDGGALKNISLASVHSALNSIGESQRAQLFREEPVERTVEVSAKPGPLIVADTVHTAVETVVLGSREVTELVSRRIALGQTGGGGAAVETTPRPGAGLVVIPSQGEEVDEAFIEAIKQQFSDEVRVRPDSDGEGGVIQPVFRDGPGDEYLYLLLPADSDE